MAGGCGRGGLTPRPPRGYVRERCRGPAHPPCSACQAPQPWPLGRRQPAAACSGRRPGERVEGVPPRWPPPRLPAAPLTSSPQLCSLPEMTRPEAFRSKHRHPLAGAAARLGADSAALRTLQGRPAIHCTGCWPAGAGISVRFRAGRGCRTPPRVGRPGPLPLLLPSAGHEAGYRASPRKLCWTVCAH